ncbi:MAG: FkbM family methyltransferase [Conexivisphaerales archaeon]
MAKGESMFADTFESIKRYRSHYRNYLSCLYHVWRGHERIHIILKDGYEDNVSFDYAINIARFPDVTKIANILKELNSGIVNYKGTTIYLNGLPHNGDPFRVFIYEEYKFLDVYNKTVIDIGANIGDSPIYFAINGAKKVIALEPYPHSYRYALENVKKNNLEQKVILLNAGYGKDSEIEVDENEVSGLGSRLTSKLGGKKIKIFSLKTLLQKYSIDDAVLKMDCEGCEYGLLDEECSVLSKFNRIAMEYHLGPEKIIDKLKKCGFAVYVREETRNRQIGNIYAEKVQ